jgi:small subunit ribosomal protein S6e
MAIKLNISDKGVSWRLEVEFDVISGKNIGDVFDGKEIKSELEGYELEITGGSDVAGFPLSKNIEGIALQKRLLEKGFGMRNTKKGIRLRKSIRGKQISNTTAQINIKVRKQGKTPLSNIFSDQNKPKEEQKKEEKK